MKKHQLASAAILAVPLLLLAGCGLDPIAYEPPADPGLGPENGYTISDVLATGEPLSLGGFRGPEDIAAGPDGKLYAGFHTGNFTDGGILRMNSDGSHREIFANTGAWVTGLHFDSAGRLLACVVGKGVFRFSADGTGELLVSDYEGERFLIPNDIVTDSRGRIYFTVTSHHALFGQAAALKIILEARLDDGALYVYDPATRKTTRLMGGLNFANGVAIAKDDSYALVVDTGRYRVWKLPLHEGAPSGKPEVFLDNLPGIPNGIALRELPGHDTEYWLGFTTRRSALLDAIHPYPALKSFIYSVPSAMRPAATPYGLVLLVRDDRGTGRIVAALQDTTGEVVSEASSVEESGGDLYLGGDMTSAIVRFRLSPELL